MNIPRFWARAHEGPVACWRSSHVSQDDAETQARAAVEQLAVRQARGELDRHGGYGYPDRPLREEILEEQGVDGEPGRVVLTRNAYGAVVLNTADVMFIDIDFAPRARSTVGLLARVLGLGAPAADPLAPVSDIVRSWASGNDAGSARLYRTAGGARVLLTDGYYDPTADTTAEIMQAFGADPQYRQLCRAQESFRARLTPKPWRCGVSAPTVRWPYGTAQERDAAEGWQASYDAACARASVCTLVDVAGEAPVPDGVQRVVDVHDRWVGAETPLPLA